MEQHICSMTIMIPVPSSDLQSVNNVKTLLSLMAFVNADHSIPTPVQIKLTNACTSCSALKLAMFLRVSPDVCFCVCLDCSCFRCGAIVQR